MCWLGLAGLLSVSTAAHAPVAAINPNDVTMNVQIGNDTFKNVALNWIAAVDPTT